MKSLIFSPNLDKSQLAELVERYLTESGFSISNKDFERPWGGFFVLDESQIRQFKDTFFTEVSLPEAQFTQKLSPKFCWWLPGHGFRGSTTTVEQSYGL